VPAPSDPYPDSPARIINARIQGDDEAAFAAVNEIRFKPPDLKKEQWPAMSVIAKVYARDYYQCRYCGERLILTAVMLSTSCAPWCSPAGPGVCRPTVYRSSQPSAMSTFANTTKPATTPTARR
jgi:hypothetical protein